MPPIALTRATPRTTRPAAEAALTNLEVSYACAAQGDGPLREAAYRLAKLATCHIDLADGRWICKLELSTEAISKKMTVDVVRRHFIDAVNDENIRIRLGRDAEGLRNVIVALAFGALARDGATTPNIAA